MEFLDDCVEDDRVCCGGEGEVFYEDGGEEFGGERRGEIPFYSVDEVDCSNLDVELSQ